MFGGTNAGMPSIWLAWKTLVVTQHPDDLAVIVRLLASLLSAFTVNCFVKKIVVALTPFLTKMLSKLAGTPWPMASAT